MALNKFVLRPTHPFPLTREIIEARPPEAKLFCKLDAVHGYFQLALDNILDSTRSLPLPMGAYGPNSLFRRMVPAVRHHH